MEKEKRNSSSTASSTIHVSCGGAKIKQEEMEDKTLGYQRNLDKILDEYTARYEQLLEKKRIHWDEAFDMQVEALIKFHREYGHWEVSKKGLLSNWVKKLRQIFRYAYYKGESHGSNILPRHRYDKLVAIGFPFVENKAAHEDYDDSINDRSCSSASSSSEVNQEEMEDRTLEYERNLEKMLDGYTERYEMLPEKKKKVFDATFDRHVEALVDFHREYGHWKVPPKSNQSGLCQWLFNLRNIYKCAYYHRECYNATTLPRHRYEKLVAIGYPFDEIKGEEEEDRTFEYQANLNKVLGEYTERYEKLPLIRQIRDDEAFDRLVEALVDFHREYGNWEVPRTGKYTSLYTWVKKYRQIFRFAYYKGENYGLNILPKHRYEKLVAIGFPFVENETAHEDDSLNTTSSNSVLGSSEVKQEEKEDGTLEYQANLEKVLDEYTKRYEKLPEKCQIRHDKAFNRHVEALVEFHHVYRHWKVPSNVIEKKYIRLHSWLKSIHHIYKCAYYDGNLCHAFPRHRYEKLVSIGYPFEEIMPSIPSLVSMRQEENILDFNVRRSKRVMENDQKKVVSISVGGVKEEDTKRDSIDYNRNLDEVIREYTHKYEQLSKIQKQIYEEKFDAHFQRLVDFLKEFGHFKIPKYGKDYSTRQLHNWVEGIHNSHQYAYFHGKNNGNFRLTRDRYDRLVAIGFPFEVIESEQKDPSNSRLYLKKHNSTASERNATKPSKAKMQKMLLTKTSADKKEKATTMKMSHIRTQNCGENELQSLKTKILELEKENETHYATIYRLKDEKDALEEKVEGYKKRVHLFECDKDESTASSSSKRQ